MGVSPPENGGQSNLTGEACMSRVGGVNVRIVVNARWA